MYRHLLFALLVVCSLAAVPGTVAAQDSTTLTVSVVTEDGTGVGGATIEATWDSGSTTATTASNGKAFVDVPAGVDVQLDAESDEYVRNTPVVVEDADEQDVEIEVAPKGRLTVETTGDDGPVEGVRVRLIQDGSDVVDANTDADGTFTTPIIEQGEYTLRLFETGYYRNVTSVTVSENSSVSVRMQRGEVDVRFEVVDDHFEEPRPLEGAEVAVTNVGNQRTSSSGGVTFTVPVNNRYSVSATKDGYRTNETTEFVGTSEETVRLVINRERSLTVVPANERMVVGETVAVTVHNAYNESVANATVFVHGEEVATTNEEGRARVPIEETGNNTITAEFDGVTSAEATVEGVSGDAEGTESPSDTETATGSPTGTTADEGVDLPGFGPVAALVAVLAVAGLAARRRT
jgi:PGF-CTERM protein